MASVSTTDKHRDFVREPMGEKPVTKLPGIDKAYGKRFEEMGIRKAYQILGHFLLLRRDARRFRGWLKDTCDLRPWQQDLCYNSLREWCEFNL